MPLPSVFVFHEQVTAGILALLKRTTLGAQGAKYQHLDTEQRIHHIDNPLFLSVERRERVLGTITFCRRGPHWYIRYFAFDALLQTQQNHHRQRTKNGTFKRALEQFFVQQLDPANPDSISSFYAYIDPNNFRSMRMAQQFGFSTVGYLGTQTFSRRNPQAKMLLHCSYDAVFQQGFLRRHFGEESFFYGHASSEQPCYFAQNERQEITAFAKITRVNWRIERLPGKLGGILVKLLPYLPYINQLIDPQHHAFLVVEGVWVKDERPESVAQFLESILAQEQKKLIIWWVDDKSPFYTRIRHKMRWGLLHRIMGVQRVAVVQRKRLGTDDPHHPMYVAGLDLV